MGRKYYHYGMREVREARLLTYPATVDGARRWIKRLATSDLAFHIDDDATQLDFTGKAGKHLEACVRRAFKLLGYARTWQIYGKAAGL